MISTAAILAAMQFEQVGPNRYTAGNVSFGSPVVFGGQLIAQSIAAATLGNADKRVKTVHTIFARAGSPAAPLDVTVEPMHSGRAFASATVSFTQGDRLCARSLVLLNADEPDFIHHEEPAPTLAVPAAGPADGQWQFQVTADVEDPALVGPPDLDVWARFDGAPDDPVLNQVLLAFGSESYLIATAMRPHEGVGQAQAHVSVSTGVISHTLTFHQPFVLDDWHLLRHHSPYAGNGRSYGRCDVFSNRGRLVASFVQDAMIRPMPQGSTSHL